MCRLFGFQNQTTKKTHCTRLQESVSGKEPPQSSKGPAPNQTKTISVASGTHLVCEEVGRLDGISFKARTLLYHSLFVCKRVQRNSLCTTDIKVGSDPRINTVVKSCFLLWARWQVASNTGVTVSYTTAFFRGLHGGALSPPKKLSRTYDMTAEWPADHTNEPNFEKKAWTRRRQKLARCTESFSSEKAFSFLGPFTQGFVWFLPKGHTCGPSSISLIISVDKPLKNLISFYNSPSF